MSQATSVRPTSRRRLPKWVPWVAYSLLGLLGLTAGIYILTMSFGAVHGVEFSPQTFERRSYSVYELPIVGWQITGIKREDVTGTTETFLTSQKYVTPPAGVQPEWHIVIGSHGARLKRKGDAFLLAQYLDAKDSNDYHRWVKWSEDNPKLAKVFWPAVQTLAANDLYVFLPDLFDVAKLHTARQSDAGKLQTALRQEVSRRLLFLANRYQQREEHAEAVKVLDEALKADPENQELKRARDTAKVAAGSAKSKASK